jgi:hypothetical protein
MLIKYSDQLPLTKVSTLVPKSNFELNIAKRDYID